VTSGVSLQEHQVRPADLGPGITYLSRSSRSTAHPALFNISDLPRRRGQFVGRCPNRCKTPRRRVPPSARTVPAQQGDEPLAPAPMPLASQRHCVSGKAGCDRERHSCRVDLVHDGPLSAQFVDQVRGERAADRVLALRLGPELADALRALGWLESPDRLNSRQRDLQTGEAPRLDVPARVGPTHRRDTQIPHPPAPAAANPARHTASTPCR
jgi:hypothetical protein